MLDNLDMLDYICDTIDKEISAAWSEYQQTSYVHPVSIVGRIDNYEDKESDMIIAFHIVPSICQFEDKEEFILYNIKRLLLKYFGENMIEQNSPFDPTNYRFTIGISKLDNAYTLAKLSK